MEFNVEVMKNILLKLSRYVLGVLGIACVSACDNDEDDDLGGTLCMYGTPTADFVVNGKVVNADGEPINGIAVYADDMYGREETVYTEADGSFSLRQKSWFPQNNVDLIFEDQDGEENGGYFGKKEESVALVKTQEGDGWYAGVFSSEEDITVVM